MDTRLIRMTLEGKKLKPGDDEDDEDNTPHGIDRSLGINPGFDAERFAQYNALKSKADAGDSDAQAKIAKWDADINKEYLTASRYNKQGDTFHAAMYASRALGNTGFARRLALEALGRDAKHAFRMNNPRPPKVSPEYDKFAADQDAYINAQKAKAHNTLWSVLDKPEDDPNKTDTDETPTSAGVGTSYAGGQGSEQEPETDIQPEEEPLGGQDDEVPGKRKPSSFGKYNTFVSLELVREENMSEFIGTTADFQVEQSVIMANALSRAIVNLVQRAKNISLRGKPVKKAEISLFLRMFTWNCIKYRLAEQVKDPESVFPYYNIVSRSIDIIERFNGNSNMDINAIKVFTRTLNIHGVKDVRYVWYAGKDLVNLAFVSVFAPEKLGKVPILHTDTNYGESIFPDKDVLGFWLMMAKYYGLSIFNTMYTKFKGMFSGGNVMTGLRGILGGIKDAINHLRTAALEAMLKKGTEQNVATYEEFMK
jgi:hypothetical protein